MPVVVLHSLPKSQLRSLQLSSCIKMEPQSQNEISADNQIGKWRGWEKAPTKQLDRLKRFIESMSLVTELEQCDQPDSQVNADSRSVIEMSTDQNTNERNKSPEDLSEFIKTQLENLLQGVTYSSREPPFSFTIMIVMALMSTTKRRLSLSEIFNFIQDKFPFYRSTRGQWKTSVNSTLKWNKVFMKKCSSICQSGALSEHEGCWRVDPWTASQILLRASSLKQHWSPLPAKKVLQESNVLNSNFPRETEENNLPLVEKTADCQKKLMSDEKCTESTNDELNGSIFTHKTIHNPLETKRDYVQTPTVVDEKTNNENSEEIVRIAETPTEEIRLENLENTPVDPKISSKVCLQLEKTCYTCELCEKNFICSFLFKCHVMGHDNKLEIHACNLCHEFFLSIHILWLHMQNLHCGQENLHTDSDLCSNPA